MHPVVTAPEFKPRTLYLLIATLIALIGMTLLGSLVVSLLAVSYDLSIGQTDTSYTGIAERQQLRLLLLLNNLFVFCLSATVALYATYRDWWTVAAGLVVGERKDLIVAAIVTFVVGLPVIALSAFLNLQLDLPDWMVRSEETGNTLLAGVLTFESVPELLMALLTVAVVPAMGEELLFRGIVQKRLLGSILSDHLAIWITAFLFSAIHLEFAGFLPRFFLGALLGYAYRWTGSLWIPILLHFTFNGAQVLATFVSGEFTPDTEMDADPGSLLLWGALSLLGAAYVGWRTERRFALPRPLLGDER